MQYTLKEIDDAIKVIETAKGLGRARAIAIWALEFQRLLCLPTIYDDYD